MLFENEEKQQKCKHLLSFLPVGSNSCWEEGAIIQQSDTDGALVQQQLTDWCYFCSPKHI